MRFLKYFNALSLFALATIVLPSCEKEVSLKVPPTVPKLVIGSYNISGLPVMVQVTHSISLREFNSPVLTNMVGDATVKLYTDGIFTEQLTFDTSFGSFISAAVPVAGKQYTLKVSAPGYANAEASVTAPDLVIIDSFSRIPRVRKDENGAWQDELKLTFTDKPTPGDYYIIRLQPGNYMAPPGSGGGHFCVFSADPHIEDVSGDLAGTNTCLDNNGIFLRDALFNGAKKEVKLYWHRDSSAYYVDTNSYHIELLHVPESYFRHYKSSLVAFNSNGDPFAEPINVYSNVQNGYGVFTINSGDMREIER